MYTETLTGATLTLEMGNIVIPCTVTLASSEVGRKIEISTDGTNFFEPDLDKSAAGFIVTSIFAPIAKIKVTGAASDVLSIVSSEAK